MKQLNHYHTIFSSLMFIQHFTYDFDLFKAVMSFLYMTYYNTKFKCKNAKEQTYRTILNKL